MASNPLEFRKVAQSAVRIGTHKQQYDKLWNTINHSIFSHWLLIIPQRSSSCPFVGRPVPQTYSETLMPSIAGARPQDFGVDPNHAADLCMRMLG